MSERGWSGRTKEQDIEWDKRGHMHIHTLAVTLAQLARAVGEGACFSVPALVCVKKKQMQYSWLCQQTMAMSVNMETNQPPLVLVTRGGGRMHTDGMVLAQLCLPQRVVRS